MSESRREHLTVELNDMYARVRISVRYLGSDCLFCLLLLTDLPILIDVL